jgi:hypothetical protein
MRNLLVYTCYLISLKCEIKGDRLDGVCILDGGYKKCIQNFDGEIFWKADTWRIICEGRL